MKRFSPNRSTTRRTAACMVAVVLLGSASASTEITPPTTTDGGGEPVTRHFDGGGFSLLLSIPSDHFQTGQTVPVTVAVTAPPGGTFSIDIPKDAIGQFDIRDVVTLPGADRGSMRLDLTTYESGAVGLPPLVVSYRAADGTEGTLQSEELTLTIGTLLDGTFDPNEFRDIKPAVLIEIGSDWWRWIAAAVTIGGIGAAVWMLRRRASIPERVVPAHEWALTNLDRLAADNLPAKQDYLPYWVRLSGILREYVELRFGVAAPDRTSQEFLTEVRDHPEFNDDQRGTLAVFLRTADRIKFAANIPMGADCDRGMAIARTFVSETRPQEVVAAPSSSATPPLGNLP
ncbi:MAG: hypothetical protein EXS00_06875 [Phycisphaerales bacterium]|nr:hypothetical protein [Phycisphaerales bacterium]